MVGKAEQVLGYRFRNPSLLSESLTHASSTDDRRLSNERQEFFGDAILGYVVCEYLFEHFPQFQEGELTKIKSAVVSRRCCAQITHQLHLEELLIVGKGVMGRSAMPQSMLAGVFESVIAAIYLDGGMAPAREFILKHLRSVIEEAARSTHQQNFKSALQHYAQKYLPTTAIYLVLDEKGPDHCKCFEVCAEIDGKRFASAWAKSKKEAEQAAALEALRQLDQVLESDGDHVILKPLED